MGVIDKFVRQHRVQNRFNRRSWRPGAGHLGGQLVHHLRIGQRLDLRELQQGSIRTGANPSASIVSKSQPLPLT